MATVNLPFRMTARLPCPHISNTYTKNSARTIATCSLIDVRKRSRGFRIHTPVTTITSSSLAPFDVLRQGERQFKTKTSLPATSSPPSSSTSPASPTSEPAPTLSTKQQSDPLPMPEEKVIPLADIVAPEPNNSEEERAKRKVLRGVVVSTGKMQRTVTAAFPRLSWVASVRKHFQKETTRLVHDPNDSVRTGDIINLVSMPPGEPRRLSKHVYHVLHSIEVPFGEPLEDRPPVLTVEQLQARWAQRSNDRLARRKERNLAREKKKAQRAEREAALEAEKLEEEQKEAANTGSGSG